MYKLPLYLLGISLLLPSTLSAASLKERGAALYAEYCANCHGPLATTDKPNRPYGRIASAIRVVPSMYYLKRLSSEEIDALVAATEQPGRDYRGRR